MLRSPKGMKTIIAPSPGAESRRPPRLLSSLVNHGFLAFIAVAIIGVYHFVLGVRDLGQFLLGVSGIQILMVSLSVLRLSGKPVAHVDPFPIWARRRNLDIVAGENLALACGVLALAGGIFFIIKGQVPPYYGDFGHSMQMSWLAQSQILGPIGILGYALQRLRRYFTFSLICTIAATFSAFFVIGYMGGFIGLGAIFLVAISKDDFLN